LVAQENVRKSKTPIENKNEMDTQVPLTTTHIVTPTTTTTTTTITPITLTIPPTTSPRIHPISPTSPTSPIISPTTPTVTSFSTESSLLRKESLTNLT